MKGTCMVTSSLLSRPASVSHSFHPGLVNMAAPSSGCQLLSKKRMEESSPGVATVLIRAMTSPFCPLSTAICAADESDILTVSDSGEISVMAERPCRLFCEGVDRPLFT